jgi:hypothetical protein
MALANVACVLSKKAAQGKEVLMVDWDLEAPGLHRFFPSAERTKKDVGVVDVFETLGSPGPSLGSMRSILEDAPIRAAPSFFPNLFMMVAGRQDDKYASRVGNLRWQSVFNEHPDAFETFVSLLNQRFEYILIDTRTGVTDAGGICTALLPEKLVAVFTTNAQSLDGALVASKAAVNYRRQTNDPRPLVLYPLPSRVENSELKLKELWRRGDQQQQVTGFQPEFEALFQEIYSLRECSLDRYFDEAEIQHMPAYAYGERVAVLEEKADERLSLSRSYRRFTELLVGDLQPWELGIRRFDIFISSVPEDSQIAQNLARALRDNGIWIWHEGSMDGSILAWDQSIIDAIKRAKVVLFLVTPRSITNPNFIYELGVAQASGARIMPVFSGAVRAESLPAAVRQIPAIDAKHTTKLAAILKGLMAGEVNDVKSRRMNDRESIVEATRPEALLPGSEEHT